MITDCDKLTARVEDAFGQERRITLMRGPNGLYEEADGTPETRTEPRSVDVLTAIVEGRLGEEHRISLVRQPNGRYEEVLDPADGTGL